MEPTRDNIGRRFYALEDDPNGCLGVKKGAILKIVGIKESCVYLCRCVLDHDEWVFSSIDASYGVAWVTQSYLETEARRRYNVGDRVKTLPVDGDSIFTIGSLDLNSGSNNNNAISNIGEPYLYRHGKWAEIQPPRASTIGVYCYASNTTKTSPLFQSAAVIYDPATSSPLIIPYKGFTHVNHNTRVKSKITNEGLEIQEAVVIRKKGKKKRKLVTTITDYKN